MSIERVHGMKMFILEQRTSNQRLRRVSVADMISAKPIMNTESGRMLLNMSMVDHESASSTVPTIYSAQQLIITESARNLELIWMATDRPIEKQTITMTAAKVLSPRWSLA